MKRQESLTPTKYAPELYDPSDLPTHDHWGIDGAEATEDENFSYNARFAELLKELGYSTIFSLIANIKKQHGTGNVLDLMGGGYFLEPDEYDEIDHIIGIRLDDPEAAMFRFFQNELTRMRTTGVGTPESILRLENKLQKLGEIRTKTNREVLFGSIYFKDTWRHLSMLMENKSIQKFDVILCKPESPFSPSSFPENISPKRKIMLGAVFDKIFQVALSKLNQEHGLMLLQVPEIYSQKWVEAWVKKIEKRYRVKTTLKHNAHYDQAFREEGLMLLVELGNVNTHT